MEPGDHPESERGTTRIRLVAPGKPARTESFLGGRLEVTSTRGVRGPERALLAALDLRPDGKVLVVGTRDALLALAVARLEPEASVDWLALDAYERHRVASGLRRQPVRNLSVRLAGDLPQTGEYDWVLVGVSQTGDSMLSTEILRQSADSVSARGKLLAATDNSKDRWLHDRVVEVFGAATIHARTRDGAAYVARKQPGRRPRDRDFRREFLARVLGHEIQLETRPGVFSHGELDEGTLALSELAVVGETTRTLDLGCGSGAIGIAAALAAPRGLSLLVDSSPRAVAVAASNVRRNHVERRSGVLLAHDLSAVADASFDLVLANPPYFSDYRIVEQFARDSRRVLRSGGELLLVTKTPDIPREIIEKAFGAAEVSPRRGYRVIRGRCR